MLIREAEIWRRGRADLRIADGRIAAIGLLEAREGEVVVEAHGGALIPGLHDHHIHLCAEAVRRHSVRCGPPEVANEADLARALATPGEDWLRGIDYTESVAGMLSRHQLDAMQPGRPVRIQDRTGRMWFFNSRGIEELRALAELPPAFDVKTGRLFDGDAWLRGALQGAPPDLCELGAELGRYGVTGMTDMSPANDPVMAAHFAWQQESGALPQKLVVAGNARLAHGAFDERLQLGPGKLHLHDAALPDPHEAAHFIRAIHEQGRAIAVHCVTEAELVVALAALREAGAQPGDRIEHAGIAPDHLVADMAALALHVCVNPAFIQARGDRYLAEVEPELQPLLYRLAGLRNSGIVLAGGSDAPYGPADPWAAMRAAVRRTTASGQVIASHEALDAEAALGLYLADPLDLSRTRQVDIGEPADLVLLDRPWHEARERLLASDVRLAIAAGSGIHQSIDEAPL